MTYVTISESVSTNTSGSRVLGHQARGAFNKCYQLFAKLDCTVAQASNSPKLDVSIQQSLDGQATWQDFINFTQLTTSADDETLTDADGDVTAFAGDLRLRWLVTGGLSHGVLTVDPAGANNKYTITGKQSIPSDDNVTSLTVVAGAAGDSIGVVTTGTDIVVTLAVDAGVKAVYQTSLTGNNNDLAFTARAVGTAGNSYRVVYTDPSAESQPLSVSFDGTTITVLLATNAVAGGTITSTAQQILNACMQIPALSAAMSVTLKSGNDGSGVVTAMTVQALVTGAAPAITSTSGNVGTAIAANTAANALVGYGNFAGNDGTGLCAALAKTYLSNNTTEVYTFTLTGFAK